MVPGSTRPSAQASTSVEAHTREESIQVSCGAPPDQSVCPGLRVPVEDQGTGSAHTQSSNEIHNSLETLIHDYDQLPRAAGGDDLYLNDEQAANDSVILAPTDPMFEEHVDETVMECTSPDVPVVDVRPLWITVVVVNERWLETALGRGHIDVALGDN
ncbi:hypothetical protein V6N12_045812 [Hibiscus sabdariffa]|uniref:Uncharacterized protein n=1 Tax=Hibiscus sabdariffa TaxID=183260 RepID=A0ABR2G3U0_9ROSI